MFLEETPIPAGITLVSITDRLPVAGLVDATHIQEERRPHKAHLPSALLTVHWGGSASGSPGLGLTKPETCPQAICRQDHEEVMAIRVDPLSIIEMELQQQDTPLNARLSPPLRRQRRRSQDLTIDPPGGHRQSDGSVAPVPEPSPASLGPARATGPGEPPQGVSTAQLPAARDKLHWDILRVCQNKALGQLWSIDERQFIHQLYLCATLLDRGFQQQLALCRWQQRARPGGGGRRFRHAGAESLTAAAALLEPEIH